MGAKAYAKAIVDSVCCSVALPAPLEQLHNQNAAA